MSNYLSNQFGLQGKRALVTGAGRGIGRAIAEALALAGAEVLVHYNSSEQPARELVEKINKSGGKAWSAGADLTEPSKVHGLFESIQKRWDSLDILVNNAGDLVARSKVENFTDDLLDRVMRLNFNSAVYVTRGAI